MHPALTDQQVLDRIASVEHWYHRIEVRPGITTPGINDSSATLARLQLPEDCRGLRVLDVGARDGYFAFELERRGAEVVAVDYVAPDVSGFDVARELVGASVRCEVCNIYDLDPERHGTFDIVLFLGLLYHLRNPLLALDRLREVSRPGALLVVETQLIDEGLLVPDGGLRSLRDLDPVLEEVCLVQFYPGDALNGDHTNYWAPNAAAMRGMLRDAGFACDAQDVAGARGIFHARRADEPVMDYHRRLERTTQVEVGR